MNRLVKTGLLFGAVVELIVVSLVLSQNVFAAPSISKPGTDLTTSPIYTDLVVKPGDSISTTLQVQNNAKVPVLINIKLEEFRASGDAGEAQIYEPPPGDLATKWVQFSENNFLAQPGVWNNITMTISVPSYAAFGYYYAVLFTPSAATTQTNHVTDKVLSSNAILVLLNANIPGEKQQLSVTSLKATKGIYQYLPATFNLNIKNVGNVFVIPSGDIYISRTLTGPVIDTLNINPGGGNILPASNRNFTAQWADGFPVYLSKRVNGKIVTNKKGQPILQLTWKVSNLGSFRIGHYYARYAIIYTYDDRDIPVNGFITFWVMPWLVIIMSVVSILTLPFIVLAAVLYTKRRKSKKYKTVFIVFGVITLIMIISTIYASIYLFTNLK